MEVGEDNDFIDDEYEDEIIDLGDDVQPFSMSFKPEPILKTVPKNERLSLEERYLNEFTSP